MFADYIHQYSSKLNVSGIIKLREEKTCLLSHKTKMKSLKTAYDGLPAPFKTSHVDLNGSVVNIGSVDELAPGEHESIQKMLQALIPWKKGPFRLFGTDIDAEWRSDLKWNRIISNIGEIEGQKIADIGCNNSYYIYRLAHFNPKLVVGFDIFANYLYSFNFIQRYLQNPSLYFEYFGAEHINLYNDFFDTVLCLGLLYHLKDPINVLMDIHRSLRSGGKLIIECQGINGTEPVALCPNGRYAGSRGIWFLPTVSCLVNWLKRTGFTNIECFYSDYLDVTEQRTTPWAPIKSFSDFLDPVNSRKTVEGYPAPMRIYVKATK